MKKMLPLILFSSIATSAGIQAEGWKWSYFWDSGINQLLVGYGSLALMTGIGSHLISARNQPDVNNAMLDKKILKQIAQCIYSKQSTATLIGQVEQLHITQNEKESLRSVMQDYNQDINIDTETANLLTLINVHLAKVNVVLRYENTGNKLIKHSKYAAIGLLIYNILLRDGQLSSFIKGVQIGMRNSRR